MERSRGGLTTKIHRTCDALGLSVNFHITAGQREDRPQAISLLEGNNPTYIIADIAYDSDEVIPSLTAIKTLLIPQFIKSAISLNGYLTS